MTVQIPEWNEYFFRLADVAASRSSCLRRQVGAVVVRGRHVISTGYNGTPTGFKNCNEGGCPRCVGEAESGTGYDACTCVHAEQNAIALAARYGAGTQGGSIYLTSIQPCLSCLKSIVQAGIVQIYVGVPHGHQITWIDEAYRSILYGADCGIMVVQRERLVWNGQE